MNSNETITHGSNNFQSKDKFFANQTRIYFNYLHSNIATNSMVAKATGISHKNLCSYKRTLQRNGQLFEVKIALCEVTKHRATYLTTNKNLL